jgi:hypothetical protein
MLRIVEDKADTGGLRWYGLDKPSVTTVLDVIVKPYLEKWKRQKGEREAKRISGEATALGTRVHTLWEQVFNGQDPAYVQHASFGPEEHEKFKQAARDFMAEYIDRILETEIEVVSYDYGYGGTCDLYARLQDGTFAVFDLKTSKRLSDEVPLQTWAYSHALLETGRRVDRRFAVHVRKDPPSKIGTYKVVEHHAHEDDKRGFLGALNLFKWVHRSTIEKRMGSYE